MKIGQNELKKTLCPPHQRNSTSRGSWKGSEKDGVQNEKERYAIIAQLKEFQLQAEKHLCRIPVIDQTYIYTEGHLLIFQWKKKKKRERIRTSFIPELIEGDKGFMRLVVKHLVAPWQLSHAFLSGTSHLVRTLEKCPHFHYEFGDLTTNIIQLESQHRDYSNFLAFKETALEVFFNISKRHERNNSKSNSLNDTERRKDKLSMHQV